MARGKGGGEDRSEKPTAKRKRQARKDGQIARAPDLSGWVVVLAATMILPVLLRSATAKLVAEFALAGRVMRSPTLAGAMGVFEQGLHDTVSLLLPTVGALAAVAVFANVAQSGLGVSWKAAAPRWDRLNPLAGLRRMVGADGWLQLGREVLKLGALVGVAWVGLDRLGRELVSSRPVAMTPVVSAAGAAVVSLVRDVAALGLALSVADYAVVRRRTNKALKMTKHEVKEEHRQAEGDPLVRAQRRRSMYRMSRSRMMAAVAGADVIVVNPTHYSVALRYDARSGQAPRVVAKGSGELALRIRAAAAAAGVPIVEDPPLARTLHGACELDDEVPAELYVAVARLLAFVFTLPGLARSMGVVHRRPVSTLVA